MPVPKEKGVSGSRHKVERGLPETGGGRLQDAQPPDGGEDLQGAGRVDRRHGGWLRAEERSPVLELRLPWPPSLNKLWVPLGRGRLVLSSAGRKYKKAVEDSIWLQRGAKHISYPIDILLELYPPTDRLKDADNYSKAVLDALTDAGTWDDDSLIESILAVKMPVKGEVRLLAWAH